MNFDFRPEDLEHIKDNPHELGYLVGLDKLTPLHSDWIKDVWIKKLPLQAHRGSYKTTAVAEIGSLWWHLFHPDDRIGIFRKPYTEAAKTVRTIRKFYEIEAIQALFYYAHGIYPKFEQRKENMVVFNFKKTNTNEGSLNAYSIDKVKTGTHLDEAIVDDFVTLLDRISKAARENTDQGVMELQTNIMDPGQTPGYIGTPWHKADSWRLVLGKLQKYDIHKTKFLTPEQIALLKTKTTASLFACNYELKHIADENAIFTDPMYEHWNWKISPVFAHIDAKYSGDHTNGFTIMVKDVDGRIRAKGWTFECHIKEKISWMAETCRKYHVKRIYVEENADKGYVADLLRKEKINVKEYHEKTNKHVRIVSYLKEYWDNIIWDITTQPEYMEQIVDYIEGQEPDDCPDSAADLLREAFYKKGSNMALWEK